MFLLPQLWLLSTASGLLKHIHFHHHWYSTPPCCAPASGHGGRPCATIPPHWWENWDSGLGSNSAERYSSLRVLILLKFPRHGFSGPRRFEKSEEGWTYIRVSESGWVTGPIMGWFLFFLQERCVCGSFHYLIDPPPSDECRKQKRASVLSSWSRLFSDSSSNSKFDDPNETSHAVARGALVWLLLLFLLSLLTRFAVEIKCQKKTVHFFGESNERDYCRGRPKWWCMYVRGVGVHRTKIGATRKGSGGG